MKKSHRPQTKVKNPEPNLKSPDWVVWAAWADRITFEEIKKKTGKSESDVIKIMRKKLKPTYTYLSCYIKGADLPPHTDQADCEYTCSYILKKPKNKAKRRVLIQS